MKKDNNDSKSNVTFSVKEIADMSVTTEKSTKDVKNKTKVVDFADNEEMEKGISRIMKDNRC